MQVKDLQLKRLLRAALLVLLLSVVGKTNAIAQDFTVGNLNYTLNGNGATVTGHVDGLYATGLLVIPESVSCNGTMYPVTTISAGAFYGCSGFTGNLTIPNSVTTIGEGAFYGCSGFTGSLTISNSVTSIETTVFEECSGFTGDLIIPNSVTSICDYAFYGCSGFTGDLVIPNSVTMIGYGAFAFCSGFSEVHYNATNIEGHIGVFPFSDCGGRLVIGDNVMRIPTFMFHGAAFIGDLTIPNFVTSIGGYAFDNCSGFTGILTIPSSVTSIGENAFAHCSGFTEVHYNATNCADFIFPSPSLSGDTNPFDGCGGSLIIGENVERIPSNMFFNAAFTGELTIPNSVTSIGDTPFYGCNFTGRLKIGNAITSIHNTCFDGLWYITTVEIPNSVTEIEWGAFWSSENLTSVIMFGTTPPAIDEYVFSSYYYNPDFTIYVPYESLDAYKTANNWSDYEPYIKPMFAPSVEGYANSMNNDRWTFIALPLEEDIIPSEVFYLLSENDGYDLYQFDQSAEGEEWRCYKADSFNLVNGRGYLYANAVDVNLIISGDFNEDETKEISLVYDTNSAFAGWNLVGNPFPVSAYIDREYYVMNEDGTGINPVALPASTPIPPCTGVMVKAEAEGETVVFTRAVP